MSKLVQLKNVTEGHGGGAPSRWAIFCNFLEKNGYFNAIRITFRTFSEPFEEQNF